MGNMANKNCNRKSCLNKIIYVLLIIAVGIIALIISSNLFNSKEDTQQQTLIEESLPLPDKQNEPQGSPEISKLNVDQKIMNCMIKTFTHGLKQQLSY